MKYIKTFEGLFDFFKKKDVETDPEKINIHKLCKMYNITNYKIWFNEKTGKYTVNVSEGGVNLSFKKLTKIPITFGFVRGTFDCSGNNLEDLTNSPFRVEGNYICNNQYNNTLKSLKGSPKEIDGRFNCSDNENLTSFEYGPEIIKYNIDISYTNISSFDHFPENIESVRMVETPLNLLFLGAGLDTRNIFNNSDVIDLFKEYDPVHPASTDTIDLPYVGEVSNNKSILYLDRYIDFLNTIGETSNANKLSDGKSSTFKDRLKKYYNIK